MTAVDKMGVMKTQVNLVLGPRWLCSDSREAPPRKGRPFVSSLCPPTAWSLSPVQLHQAHCSSPEPGYISLLHPGQQPHSTASWLDPEHPASHCPRLPSVPEGGRSPRCLWVFGYASGGMMLPFLETGSTRRGRQGTGQEGRTGLGDTVG